MTGDSGGATTARQPADDAVPYSTAFDVLAGDGNDLAGLVTYALYKREKRGWIISARPSPDAVRDHHIQLVEPRVESLRTLADKLLNEYGEARIKEAAPALLESGYNLQLQTISNEIQDSITEVKDTVQKTGHFGKAIGAGVVAWFVSLGLTWLIATWQGYSIVKMP